MFRNIDSFEMLPRGREGESEHVLLKLTTHWFPGSQKSYSKPDEDLNKLLNVSLNLTKEGRRVQTWDRGKGNSTKRLSKMCSTKKVGKMENDYYRLQIYVTYFILCYVLHLFSISFLITCFRAPQFKKHESKT